MPPQNASADARKRVVQKDEAVRRKFEAHKGNHIQTQGSIDNIKKEKSNLSKGTLAALSSAAPPQVPEAVSIHEVCRTFAAKRVGCCLVCNEGAVTGIVTPKDIVYGVIAEGLDPRTTAVREIMTRNPLVVAASCTPTEALGRMLTDNFCHLPICGQNNDICGFVNFAEVFREILDNARRRSTASEQLFNAMVGVKAEIGPDDTHRNILAWASQLREKTALPDLANLMRSTSQLVVVGAKVTVLEAVQLMKKKDVSAVCVMEDIRSGITHLSSRIAGIFTTWDAMLRVVASQLDPHRCNVARVMTQKPDIALSTMTIHDAVTKMYVGKYHHLPVVEDGRLTALVSMFSLAKAAQAQIMAANDEMTDLPRAARALSDNGLPFRQVPEPLTFGDTQRSEDISRPISIASDSYTRTEQADPVTSDHSESNASDASYVLKGYPEPDRIAPEDIRVIPPINNSTSNYAHSDQLSSTRSLNTASGSTNYFDHNISNNQPRMNIYPRAYSKSQIGNTSLNQRDSAQLAGAHITDAFSAESSSHPIVQMQPRKSETLPVVGPSSASDLSQIAISPMLHSVPDLHDPPVLKNVPEVANFDFKFTSPSERTYRISAYENDYKQVRERVAAKLRGDPFFVTDPNDKSYPGPDPDDFQISYKDADEDPVVITSDDDILDAVNVSRRANENRVILIIQPGRSWTVRRSPSPPAAERVVAAEIIKPMVNEPISPPRTIQENRSDEIVEAHPENSRVNNETIAESIKALSARLASIFDSIPLYRRLLNCSDADAQRLLDTFQTLLDVPGLSDKFRSNLLVATQRLSKRAGLYPTSYNLNDIEMVEPDPIAAGSFADIYKARFLGQGVCLKVIRVYQTSPHQLFMKRFSFEAILWGQLSHVNVLPIYGLYRYKGRFCLVSPWMPYGDITQFLKKYQDEDRPRLVLDVSSGISYLHSNGIVHGDLKGENILINGCRRACLADFGLAGVSERGIAYWTSVSSAGSKGGSIPWQAPELFDPEREDAVHNTKASDVYAFAGVAYEIFTSHTPFFQYTRPATVMLRIKEGERPSRPPESSLAWSSWGLTEYFWSLMQSCWQTDSSQRPSIDDIVSQYRSIVAGYDNRPMESEDFILTPTHFRDSVGGRAVLPSVAELETILNGGAAFSPSATVA